MQFNLGTIVSLKSNGLLPLSTFNFLSLGGNENFTTPLMVVVEILKNNLTDLDDETGDLKSLIKGQNKYKCIYFSNRSMKFEENWFVQNELDIYGDDTLELHNSPNASDIVWGKTVRFKTVDEEAKKSKSFNESENKKGAKPLVTFIAPAMQVVGFASPEKKEQSLDPNTGKPKREYPTKMVKCKFFNTEADKFSEQILPIECLQFINNSAVDNLLKDISKIIKEKSLALINTTNGKYFGKSNSVHVYSGRYQLSFYNELIKKQEFVWLDEVIGFHVVDFKNSMYFPGINDGSENVTSIFEFLESKKIDEIEGKHFKITYCNLKEQRVSRYITVLQKRVGTDQSESSTEIKNYYLKSYCHLREASRDFRSDRILSIRTINEAELNDFLSKKANVVNSPNA